MAIEMVTFTVDEVAKMLSISSRTVTRYCEEGLMSYRQAKIKGRLMFTPEDVSEFLETSKKRGVENEGR